MTASPYGPALWGHVFPQRDLPLATLTHGDLFDLLETAAQDHPNRPHIAFGDDTWSYRETCDLSLVLARELIGRGVRAGDRVGVCLPNTPTYVVLCFALWRIGAVGVGMNTLYSEHHLREQAANAGLSLLFAAQGDPALAKVQGAAEAAGCPLILCRADGADLRLGIAASASDDLAGMLVGPPLSDTHPRPGPEALAMLQYTGGTTGAPKGAMLSHLGLLAATRQALACLSRIERGADAWHAAAPMSHISGLLSYVCVVTAAAGEILLVARFQPDELLGQLRRGRPTVLTAIPTMLTALLSTPDLAAVDWGRVKHVLAGGAAVPLELWRRFHEVSGLSVQQAYGMTETCGAAACMPPGGIAGHEQATGAPMPGVQIEIRSLDDPDRPVPLGETGEVCIGGPNLMTGYWQVEDSCAHLTSDGLMRSGDIGLMTADGYLQVVDRLKDMVVCSGYNVYPRLIDEAVLQHPAIREAISLGVPDSYRGETILVAAALKPGQQLSLAGLQEFLAGKLSPIEMPKRLVILDDLPKSENGKLSRLLIRQSLATAG